jgi:hypothetical protein
LPRFVGNHPKRLDGWIWPSFIGQKREVDTNWMKVWPKSCIGMDQRWVT